MIPMFEIHASGLTYTLFNFLYYLLQTTFHHSYNHSAVTQRIAFIYLVRLDVNTKLVRSHPFRHKIR